MAKKPRTLQWRGEVIEDADFVDQPRSSEGAPTKAKQPQRANKQGINTQDALLAFTASSVVMVFAGGALVAFVIFIIAMLLN